MIKPGKNIVGLKISNRKNILKLLYKEGQVSRKDLAHALGLTPASITMNVNEMIQQGILLEQATDAQSKGVGRKKIFIGLNNKHKKIIGIVIDQNSVTVILGTINLTILAKKVYPLQSKHQLLYIEQAVNLIQELLDEHQLTTDDILGIGISTKGIVHVPTGENIRSWDFEEENFPIKRIVQSYFDLPVCVDNNVRALAQTEILLEKYFHQDNMLFIRYEEGIGGALTYNGEVYYGSHLSAGEIGHTYVDTGGRDLPCRCGRHNCLETVASTWSIREILSDYHVTTQTELLELYEKGNTSAIAAFEAAIRSLAISINNFIQVVDPKRVILYGYVFSNKKLLGSLTQHIFQLQQEQTNSLEIKVSTHNDGQLELLSPLGIVVNDYFNAGGLIEIK